MGIFNTPIMVGTMELKNRLVLPPMATAKSEADGRVSAALCAYYGEKAQGGHIGLVIVEHSYVSPEGKASNRQLSIADDADIAGQRELVARIQATGAKAMAQINHAGAAAKREVTGMDALSASAVRRPNDPQDTPLPREMSPADIEKVIADFADAARRVKEAGYDGVEIHSAHGYLLNQFYSPRTNVRQDAYTGSTIEGRVRLHLEVIRAVREEVGGAYPLALRLGACDYMDGGTTQEDSVAAAKLFAEAGVDLLDISGGFSGYINPHSKEQGYFWPLTKAIKACVGIPVILTGGIVDKEAAQALLEAEKADLIGVGRAILKDSLWAEKAMGKQR